ncbi:hypothetical protein QTP88_003319 [Uroleucon formosanum]
MDNPLTLHIFSSAFNYSSLSTETAITSGSTATDMDVNVNDRPNELHTGSTSSSLNNTSIQSTFLTNSDISNTNKHLNILQKPTDPVPSSPALDSSSSIYLLFNFNKANWSSYSLKIQNSSSSAYAQTTRLLKNVKRKKWKNFCSYLNPSPYNTFGQQLSAIKTASTLSVAQIMTIELNLAISSRKSTASGLNNILPIMLKPLPSNALTYFLSIMNNILSSNQVSPSWTSYRIIPILKPNSNDSFRPIALSFSLCKVFEYMLKTRLDWWLESNSVLPANLFAFRKGLGTMECFSTFIGNIYHAFNNKEFLVATFADIRGAFDSVNIPTLITHLLSLNVPSEFCNVLSALSNFRKLVFSFPFRSSNTRFTFIGLPQGSCLSPILFNVYISIVEKHLSQAGHKCLIYADDLVISSSNKLLNLGIESLISALMDLNDILNKVSFDIAPDKYSELCDECMDITSVMSVFFCVPGIAF